MFASVSFSDRMAMIQFVENLLIVLCYVVPAVSSIAWTAILVRWFLGRPAVTLEARRAVPWGLVDLMLTLMVLIGLQLAVGAVLHRWYGISVDVPLRELSAEDRVLVMTAGAIASLGTLLIALPVLHLRTGADLRDFGLRPLRVARDCCIGCIGFAMLAVPVFGLQFLLTQWMQMETKHPLVELVQEAPRPTYFVLSGFAALIVAPITEEFFFRMVLQGWLENVARALRMWRAGDEPAAELSSEVLLGAIVGSGGMTIDAQQSARSPLPPTGDDTSEEDPYRSPLARFGDGESGQAPVTDSSITPSERPASWPIVVSAVVFALAHLGHGPDPIPLFLLAVGLGYLYQRTHRVYPCIVVHFLVNAVSMLQLWVMTSQNGA